MGNLVPTLKFEFKHTLSALIHFPDGGISKQLSNTALDYCLEWPQ